MKAKSFIILLIVCCLSASNSVGQSPSSPYVGGVVQHGDTLPVLYLDEVVIYNRPVKRTKRDLRKYERLIRAFKLTYPVALDARAQMFEMEKQLQKLKTKKERDDYMKSVEKELKRRYTPFLHQISLYQGIVLMKLIDRETGNTSYELVKEFRGGFSAFFWQGIARIFGANLKTHYDPAGDDQILEQLVIMYENGEL